MNVRRLLVLAWLLTVACSRSPAGPVAPSVAPLEPIGTVPPEVAGPVDTVTEEGMLRHLEALQAIADANGGTRATGTPGYEASVEYVVGVLEASGYDVELPTTDVPVFRQDGPTRFVTLGPDGVRFVDGRDLRAMLFSDAGVVRGPLQRVEDGCDDDDFAGFAEGAIAVLESSECFRLEQVTNAQGAGAVGVVVVTAASAGSPLRPTLVEPGAVDVPAVAVTADASDALRDGAVVRMRVQASSAWETARSVVATWPGGDVEGGVMLGGHLDSVIDGPGLNDNGSGVAMLLELARWVASRDPAADVRFGFWASEESGLYGSWSYAHGLDDADAIDVYVNLDMVGSPNAVPFVYEPSGGGAAVAFTAALETALGESERIALHGSSDHAAFADVGVPTAGLYSGSQERMTAAQAAAYGGTQGQPLDPCYHQPCDTLDNVDTRTLAIHADAIVAALEALLG